MTIPYGLIYVLGRDIWVKPNFFNKKRNIYKRKFEFFFILKIEVKIFKKLNFQFYVEKFQNYKKSIHSKRMFFLYAINDVIEYKEYFNFYKDINCVPSIEI